MKDLYPNVCVISDAVITLKNLRDALAKAGVAPRLLKRIRSDLKSAQGAYNNARGKWLRAEWAKDAEAKKEAA